MSFSIYFEQLFLGFSFSIYHICSDFVRTNWWTFFFLFFLHIYSPWFTCLSHSVRCLSFIFHFPSLRSSLFFYVQVTESHVYNFVMCLAFFLYFFFFLPKRVRATWNVGLYYTCKAMNFLSSVQCTIFCYVFFSFSFFFALWQKRHCFCFVEVRCTG